MKIYEYRKHLVAGRIQDPEFITHGGHWYDIISDTYIALMPDRLPYYIPDTLVLLSIEQLIARVQLLHNKVPFNVRNGVMGSGGTEDLTQQMTDDQVANMVIEWLSTHEIK
jgi:hypothetical protein